jgi:putative DNA primase/helicase
MSAHPEVTDRPRISTSGGDIHRWADEAWAAIVVANDPTWPSVLVRGNELVRQTERGELEPFTLDSLLEHLSRVAQFGAMNDDGWKSKPPPAVVVKTLLARDTAGYPDAAQVERVVDVPVLAADGSLITQEGYHAASRLLFVPALGMAGVEPGEVDYVDDLQEAVDWLMDDLLGDFVWDDAESKANALGLLLLPFVRDFIDGPTPMHLILAPEAGTGKTLLARCALYPGCGEVATMPDARDDEEYRKRLTSALMSGARAVIFDNIRGDMSSSALASALTAGVWRDRVLGTNREAVLPVRNAWVATGNNTGLTDELARRSVPIFLAPEPGDERPSDRPKSAYKHPDLFGWTSKNRARLASAALTLVRHWQDGRVEARTEGGHLFVRGDEREASERTMGSYESWAEVIGGILHAAGVKGFLGNLDRLRVEANPDAREGRAFVEAWYLRGEDPLSLSDLTRLCTVGNPLYGALPTKLAEHMDEYRLRRPLGYWLRDNRRFGEFQILDVSGDKSRTALWAVRRTDAPSPTDGA